MSEQFTQDWFTHNLPTWERVIAPHLRSSQYPYVLEIGAFEGRASLWFLNNFPSLWLTVVDPWTEEAVRERFITNCKEFLIAGRVDVRRGMSQDVLRELIPWYDVVYVDGAHTAECVLHDAVVGFELLKDNGLLVFDDYGGGEPGVPFAVNAFSTCYGPRLELLSDGYQRIYRKRVS